MYFRNFLSFFVLLVVVFLFASCKNAMTQQELTNYINDPENGLKQEISQGDIKVSMSYRPTELIVEQETDENGSVQEREKKVSEYNKYNYFILTMSIGDNDILYRGSRNQSQFSETLNRINFELPQYIYAIGDNNDTIALADFYVPNFYGMGGSTQIMLAFPNEKKFENFEVRLRELGLGIGERRFSFKQKDLNNLPPLITKQSSKV